MREQQGYGNREGEMIYSLVKRGKLSIDRLTPKGQKNLYSYLQDKKRKEAAQQKIQTQQPKLPQIQQPKPNVYTPPELPRERTTREAGERMKQGNYSRGDTLLSSMMSGIALGAGGDKVREQSPYFWTSVIGEGAGNIAPVSKLYKGAKLLTKPISNKLGNMATTGFLAGAGMGAGKATLEGKDAKGIAKESALYGAMGAVLDPALEGVVAPLAKKGIQKVSPKLEDVLSKLPIKKPQEKQPIQDVIEKLKPDKTINKTVKLPEVGSIQSSKEVASAGEPINLADDFRGKIDRTPKTEKRTFKETLDKLRTQFVEDLAPLEKVEKKIRGNIPSAENSLYKQARLFRGTPTKANEIVRTRLSPVIENIESKGYTYKDLGDYALAVHAKDVNEKGLISGFRNDEIQAVLKKFGTPEMEAARQELIKLNDDLLQELADSQVISHELVTALKEKHPNYMPLFRAFEDDKVEFKRGLSKAIANVSSPLKKLEGSNRKAIDPIESMVKNIFQTTNAAERNKVAIQLANLAEDDFGSAFIRKLKDNESVGRKNVVSVLKNGEKVQYEVEPEVYKAMLNLDKESSNFLINILSKPASVLRAGATLTPEFSLRNPVRDIVQAFVVSKSGFNPITDSIYGLTQALMKGRTFRIGGKEFKAPGKLYNQWLQDNGGYGNIVSMDRKVHQEALNQVLRQPTSQKFTNIITGKSLINILRKIADVSESATKLGEYRAALRSGATRQEAAYRSRDIMDFARAGTSVREANKVIAFLNANIQGKSKLIRSIKEDPKGVIARSTASIMLPTIGIFLAQKNLANDIQKQTINDAPDWLKNNFWLVPIPGTDQIGRIPKPFDLAPIFANAPERFMEYVFNNDQHAFDDFVKDTFSSYSIPVMISGVLPFVEGMANYSFFKQAPIIPQREQGIMLKDQHDINTTETAKGIANLISKLTNEEGTFKNFSSPRVVDNTIRGLTAGLGSYATTGIDATLNKLGLVDRPEKPTKLLNQQPLLKAFLVNQGSTGKSMDELYKLRDRLRREKGSARTNKEPFKEQGKLKYIESMTGKIGDISKQIRLIQNDNNLDGATKRERIDKLNELRNDIARKTIEYINNR